MARIVMTGFPGFLGCELVPRVLRRHPDAIATCIVQERHHAEADQAISVIAADDPSVAERIELIDGDIGEPDLGLGPRLAEIAADTIEVYHLAAVYDLAVGRDLAWRVNVDGTKHVISFCRRCPDLRRHHYISTCYVSGRYAGPFGENDLDKDQHFNNHYEETKHLAEREVRESWGEIPTTIYRPSIVAGDAATGATQKYDGPYFVIRWLLRQPGPVALMPVVGDPNVVRLNVVPRDFVVDAIDHLAARDDNAGRCYQLADPNPMTIAEILTALSERTGKRLMRVPLTLDIAKAAIDHVPGVKRLLGFPAAAVDYFVHPTHYLTPNTERDLAGSGLSAPPFASYLDALIGFVKAHPEITSDAMV